MRLIDADVLENQLEEAISLQGIMALALGTDDEIKAEMKAYKDILNGVKEQPTLEILKPHVMTLDEIENSDFPMWLERKHMDDSIYSEWVSPFRRKDEYGYVLLGSYCLFIKDMGIDWRCWTAKPTEGQSEKEKWDKPFQ